MGKNKGRKSTASLKGWLEGGSHGHRGGMFHAALSTQSEHQRQHLAVQTSVKAGEVLLKVPSKLLISKANCKLNEVLEKAEQETQELAEELTATEQLAVTLLYEQAQERGAWSSYLKHLKSLKLDVPVFWQSNASKEAIMRTSLSSRLSGVQEEFEETFNKIVVPVLTSKAVGMSADDLSVDAFKRNCTLAMACGWSGENNDVFLTPLAEMLVTYMDEVLVPDLMVDMDNILVDSGEEFLSIIAKADLEPKERLCLSFGGVSSAESLWKFGCIARDTVTAVKLSVQKAAGVTTEAEEEEEEVELVGNPFDEVEVEPEAVFKLASADAKMAEEKLELLASFGLFGDCFSIDRLYTVPNDMMLVVKVLHMDAEEFALYRDSMVADGFGLEGDEVPELVSDAPGSSSASGSGTGGAAAGGSASASTSKAAGSDEESESEEEEEDEDDDDDEEEELPEITDEIGVYNTLGRILENLIASYPEDVTADIINGMGPIVYEKQAAQYLTLVERQILEHTLEGVRLLQEVLAFEEQAYKKVGSKRAIADLDPAVLAEAPPKKAAKKK